MTKLAEMIKNALNELGCEELPSGCDDLTVDQGFIDANGNVDQTVRQRLLSQEDLLLYCWSWVV